MLRQLLVVPAALCACCLLLAAPVAAQSGGQGGNTTMPSPISQVKPSYTADAMRARIQGTVVVRCLVQADGTVGDVELLRSLDSVYGLDEQAVNAAKQWRFVPGTRDGVAVPVWVTIELSFTVGQGPRLPPLSMWPDPFPASIATNADATGSQDSAVESNVHVQLTCPKGWTIEKRADGTAWMLAYSGQGTRSLAVTRPLPAPPALEQLLRRPALPAALQQLAEALKQQITTRGPGAEVLKVGQVKSAEERPWIWFDFWVPTRDPDKVPPQLKEAFQKLSAAGVGARVWAFTTTAGSQAILVFCSAVRLGGMSDAEAQEDVRRAAADCQAMLSWMSIEVR